MLRDADHERDWSRIAAGEPGTVLLECASSRARSGRKLLFRKPVDVIEARHPHDLPKAIRQIDEQLARGFHLAGYIAYEAGYALEPALADLACALPHAEPLLWMGCYHARQLSEGRSESAGVTESAVQFQPRYSMGQVAYEKNVEKIRELIAAGETYQANLTMDLEWDTGEPPAALYERLLRAQPIASAALLHPVPDWHVLSLSPELLFARRGQRIVTRPMKGTASRGMDAAETRARIAWLQADEKNRAENVMIVDLLRSDLGRLCAMGSVQVTKLFDVERFATILQMTSTVEGVLRQDVRYEDLFRAIFPSGSIVGAPKIHTMRLLHALEARPRGVYTGAIGYISPDGEAEFNVAIRTVSLRHGKARMGVGAGITFDSEPALEYAECLMKTAFLAHAPQEDFELIETILLQNGRLTFLEEHLQRMALSAEYFDMLFDAAHVRRTLQQAVNAWQGEASARVRLLLGRSGAVTCTISPMQFEASGTVSLLLAPERTLASDRFLRHKTTRRALYDSAFRHAESMGFADSLFLNTEDEVTEGAIHNVIACLAGEWVTPPLASGVLPGVYRRHLLEQGKVRERVLHLADLVRAEEVFVCNSVRGLRPVGLIALQREDGSAGDTLWTAASGNRSLEQASRAAVL